MHTNSANCCDRRSKVAALALGALAFIVNSPALRAETLCLDYQWSVNTANFTKYDTFIINAHVPLSPTAMATAKAAGKKFYAYISAGEIGRDAYYHSAAVAAGIPFISENPNWASDVVDLTSPLWGPFVVSQLALPAIQKGFDGFFLDTMDSYYLTSWSGWKAQEEGLVSMVKQLKAAYPTKKIIINRGFPVFGKLVNTVDGMLVEGLYYSYPGSPQEPADTTWLLQYGQIGQVKEAGLPVYIVDYVGGTGGQNQAIANQVADKIIKQGLIPCVVERNLNGTVLAPPPAPPVDPNAPMKLSFLRNGRLRFTAQANKAYTIQFREQHDGAWSPLASVSAQASARIVELSDPLPLSAPTRFYRLTTQ
jgi:uncharacterized protein (TIGR01370 family)